MVGRFYPLLKLDIYCITVRKWNMVRQERGLPILDLVRTPIAEGSASPREGRATNYLYFDGTKANYC